MTGFPLLSLLVFLPIAAAVACALLPVLRLDPLLARPIALGAALLTLALSAVLLFGYPAGSSEMHYVETAPWIPQLGVSYHLAVDGLNVLLVPLTALLAVLALKVAVVRRGLGMSRALPLLGMTVFALLAVTWASSAGGFLGDS